MLHRPVVRNAGPVHPGTTAAPPRRESARWGLDLDPLAKPGRRDPARHRSPSRRCRRDLRRSGLPEQVVILWFCAGPGGDERGLGVGRERDDPAGHRNPRRRHLEPAHPVCPGPLTRAVRIHRAVGMPSCQGACHAGVARRLAGLRCFGEPGVQPFPDLLRGVAAAATLARTITTPVAATLAKAASPSTFHQRTYPG